MWDFLSENWAEIGVLLFAFHTVAKAWSDATETKADDAFVDKLGAVVGYLFGRRSK